MAIANKKTDDVYEHDQVHVDDRDHVSNPLTLVVDVSVDVVVLVDLLVHVLVLVDVAGSATPPPAALALQ